MKERSMTHRPLAPWLRTVIRAQDKHGAGVRERTQTARVAAAGGQPATGAHNAPPRPRPRLAGGQAPPRQRRASAGPPCAPRSSTRSWPRSSTSVRPPAPGFAFPSLPPHGSASLGRGRRAGYGETAGEAAVEAAFQEFLAAQDRVPSALEATDAVVDTFLEFFLARQGGAGLLDSEDEAPPEPEDRPYPAGEPRPCPGQHHTVARVVAHT